MPLGHQHSMPQAFRFLLTDVVDVGHVADRAHRFGLLGVALAFEHPLELHRPIEVIFERTLPPPRHDQDVGEPRADGFLDHVLDRRLVHDGQHLFRLRFGSRKEPGTEPGCGDNCLGYCHGSRKVAAVYGARRCSGNL